MKPPYKIPTIDLDALKKFNVDLHQKLIEYLGLDEESSGVIQIAPTKWAGLSFRNDLIPFLQAQVKREHEKYCGCEECFQKHVSENNHKEAARLEVEKQNAPGRARLVEYIKQGLLDNLFNRNEFLNFLDEKFPGLTVITPQHVDAFVAAKRLELQWKAPESAPAPTPEPAVRTLANGEIELPIDATESEMRRASILQLKDLSKRKGEGQSWLKRGKDVGSFGANLDVGRQSQVV